MQYGVDDFVPFVLIPFIGWGVWRHLVRRDQLTALKRRTFWIGISAFFLTEMARSFYRPYIYTWDINDFHVADTIGNSLGTVTAIFMVLTLAGKGDASDWKIVGVITSGLLLYEFLNLTSSVRVDIWDLGATVVFGAISALVYHRLMSRYGSASSG